MWLFVAVLPLAVPLPQSEMPPPAATFNASVPTEPWTDAVVVSCPR